jgi:hypothetical protein
MLISIIFDLVTSSFPSHGAGIMDPDSKSAASWGDASKGQQRQPVEEVPAANVYIAMENQ